MFGKKRNMTEEFTVALSKLETIEFIGVCKVLGISVVYKEDNKQKKQKKGEPRPFMEILWELIQKYQTLGRKQKRDLLKLVVGAGKVKKQRCLNGISN